MDEGLIGGPDELVGPIAKHRLDRRTGIADEPLGVVDHGDVGGPGSQRLQPFLAASQCQLGPAFLGDVLQVPDHAPHVGVTGQVGAVPREGEPGPVGHPEAESDRLGAPAVGGRASQLPERRPVLRGADEIEGGAAHRRGLGGAEQTAQGGIGEGDRAAAVDHGGPVVGVLDEGPEPPSGRIGRRGDGDGHCPGRRTGVRWRAGPASVPHVRSQVHPTLHATGGYPGQACPPGIDPLGPMLEDGAAGGP